MADIQSRAGTGIPKDIYIIRGVFVPALLLINRCVLHILILKGGMSMEEIRNLNGKRVCDMSEDKKIVEIVQKDCITRITANPDGTLKIENFLLPKAA